MNYFAFEFGKVVYRRLSLILLIGTSFLFPIPIKVLTHLDAVQNKVPEGLFANHVAYAVTSYSHFFIFIPVWMILLVGLEFSSGHINRVAFAKSRRYYFTSKLAFTGIVTLLFSVLGMIAFTIATETSPFKYLEVSFVFYLQFLAQLLVTTLTYSVLLLCLVYWLRSPSIAFVIYFAWSLLEPLTFSVFEGFYHIELKWLPFHLLKTLYLRNPESYASADYYNPFVESPTLIIAPIGMVAGILFITYRMFIRRNLQPLSD